MLYKTRRQPNAAASQWLLESCGVIENRKSSSMSGMGGVSRPGVNPSCTRSRVVHRAGAGSSSVIPSICANIHSWAATHHATAIPCRSAAFQQPTATANPSGMMSQLHRSGNICSRECSFVIQPMHAYYVRKCMYQASLTSRRGTPSEMSCA
eukprot:364374-Chlamydomonas_euryale.AAC.11